MLRYSSRDYYGLETFGDQRYPTLGRRLNLRFLTIRSVSLSVLLTVDYIREMTVVDRTHVLRGRSHRVTGQDFAQDLSAQEVRALWAAQGPTNAAVFGAAISKAAWKTKPSWFVVAEQDRAIPPALEKAEAERMKATTIALAASHLVMISHAKEVADLIEKATANVAKH